MNTNTTATTANTIGTMPELKTQICQALLDTRRDGMPQLIAYMEQAGYFEAPASCAAHLPYTGGLAQHSWNVLEHAQQLNLTFDSPCSNESIVICALLHDLGKSGQFGKPEYVENILKSGKQSEARPYEVNKELQPIDHEVRSAMEAYKYIALTEDEVTAILNHNGMYGSLSRTKNVQNHETPLNMIIHFADLWSSRITEQKDGAENTLLH